MITYTAVLIDSETNQITLLDQVQAEEPVNAWNELIPMIAEENPLYIDWYNNFCPLLREGEIITLLSASLEEEEEYIETHLHKETQTR